MGANYSGSYAAPRLDLGEAFKEYMSFMENWIGMRVLGRFNTPKKKGSFSYQTRESLTMPANVKRAPRSAYNRGETEHGDVSFECEERGHEVPLDDSEREFYASDFDAEVAAMEQAWWRVMYDIETDIKDLVFNTTTFTTGNGLRTDVSTAWSTITSDIIGDVTDGCESVRARTGMKPNALIIGAGVVPFFIKNTAIRDAIKPTQLPSQQAILNALAALFGIDEILVGKEVYNTANEGQAFSGSDIWSNSFASIARVAPANASLQTPCLGRTMLWTADAPDAVMAEEYREEQTRSNIYRARAHCDELIIDSSFAQLLDIAG